MFLIRAVQSRWKDRRLDLAVTASIVLAGLLAVWGMSQVHRNDYEAMTVLPMLALFAVFSLAAVPWQESQAKLLGKFAAVVVAISIAGQIEVAARFAPVLWRTAASPGYIDAQPFSASAFHYSAIRSQILATARQCGIGAKGRAQHPLVDDVTYFAMMDSWQPFHRLGVLEEWQGTISDPVAYLRSRGSEGMIVGCRYLKSPWREQAKQNGEFCCISTK